MNKPEEVDCRDCRRWYWYGGSCSAHSYDEDLGIDPMSPESIEDCEYFEIKLHSEYTAEHYDPLPSLETVELVRRSRDAEYDDLIERIQSLESTAKGDEAYGVGPVKTVKGKIKLRPSEGTP